jgi:hypothetical protein
VKILLDEIIEHCKLFSCGVFLQIASYLSESILHTVIFFKAKPAKHKRFCHQFLTHVNFSGEKF